MADNSFTLIVDMPGQEPRQHEFTADLTTLGRGPDNDLQILVSEVSVKHAQFKKEGDGIKIVDSGSTNGTKVNGVRIDTAGRVLGAMDQLLLGETIKAYFVPTAMLAATPAAELIASLASQPKPAATPQTAPVAIAVKPAVALPAATPGASTVRLDQVRPSGPGPVVAPKPGAPPAAAPGPPKVAPGPPKVAPSAPGAPAAPAAPGGAPAAPRPVAPVPLQRPSAPGAPPSVPLPPSPAKSGDE